MTVTSLNTGRSFQHKPPNSPGKPSVWLSRWSPLCNLPQEPLPEACHVGLLTQDWSSCCPLNSSSGPCPSHNTLSLIQILLLVPSFHPVSVFLPLFMLYFPHKTSDAMCLPKRFRHLTPGLTCHYWPSHTSSLSPTFLEQFLCPVFQLPTIQTALPVSLPWSLLSVLLPCGHCSPLKPYHKAVQNLIEWMH